jgi:hypothetical protein
VFISSTFTDMQFERLALLRYILPTVQRRIDTDYDGVVVLHPIDLRWGVPAEAQNSGTGIGQCMRAAAGADVLVAVLGHRYGYRPTAEQLLPLCDEFSVSIGYELN